MKNVVRNAMRRGSVGVAVITYNRPELFQKCIQSIPTADVIVVINDGNPYPDSYYPPQAVVIQHRRNKGVGKSKNDALKHLMASGCEHIFLLEDDIMILRPDVFHEYIRAAKESGIRHFNFGYHGPRNKSNQGEPSPRKIYAYGDSVKLVFNKNLVGAFSYYHASVIETVGFMDPLFVNFMEHVDHTLRIIRAGFHPPFWWFADISHSNRLIEDLDPDLSKSSVTQAKRYTMHVFIGKIWFFIKYRVMPWNMPDTPENIVDHWLNHARQART